LFTGLFPPSYGSAFVGGYDITKEVSDVQLIMGLCPQFDILWGDLTLEEHVLFYARIKGMPSKQISNTVDNLLHEVGLLSVKTRLAKNLSGGMKRRLSIAISLVGDSRIVFLDEPTTGLDPASRRQIWNIIERATLGRAIILTTHSMEEAETLCTRIGIMAVGKLMCIGNQQHLKNKFGQGYRLKINFVPKNAEVAAQFVLDHFPANLIANYRGTQEYNIKKGTVKLSEVYATLEKDSSKSGITDWSLAQENLESVFQHIVKTTSKDFHNAIEIETGETSK